MQSVYAVYVVYVVYADVYAGITTAYIKTTYWLRAGYKVNTKQCVCGVCGFTK